MPPTTVALRCPWRALGCLALALLALAAAARPAEAAEYRLRVVSLHHDSFAAFLTRGEVVEGGSGAGLARLEAALDGGAFPRSALLRDRHLAPAPEDAARAYGATPLRVEVRFGGTGGQLWDEVRWTGEAGQRTVWLLTPASRHLQEVRSLALRGSGPLRYHQPYTVPIASRPGAAIALPLAFLQSQEERGTVWDRYVSPALDLGHGIGAVVGLNEDVFFPDRVYLIVVQPEQPATFEAVLAWRQRDIDREAPSWKSGMLRRRR